MSIRYLAAGLAVFLLVSLVQANGPPPRPVVVLSSDAKLVVVVDPDIKKPILKIPHALVSMKKEAPGGKPEGQAMNPLSLLISGISLTGAFICGGLWLMRSRNARAAAVGFVVCLALAGGAVLADIPRPPVRVPARIELPGNVPLTGDVTIQVVNNFFNNNVIELVVPGEKPPMPGAAPQPKPE